MFLPLFLAMLWGGSQALDSFKLQVQEFVMVQEGLCMVVPCSIFYPSRGWSPTTPAYGFWFRDQTPKPSLPVATNKPDQDVDTSTQGRFQLLGDPSESCSLLIREAHLEDSAVYFFRFERGDYVKYNFMEYKFYLEVTALTQKPEIYVPEILQPGHQVTLFCAFNWIFDECPVPTLSWIGNTVSPNEASSRTSYFSELTFTPRPQDHNTELTCRVDFSREGVSTENTVRLSVAYAPKDLVISISYTDEPGTWGCQEGRGSGVSHCGPSLAVSLSLSAALEPRGDSPHLEVQKGQSLRLLCTADSLPLATLSWTLQDRVLSWSHPLGSTALELALPRVKAEDAGRYTCRAENRLGFLSRSLDLSVQYAPENLKVMVSQANRTALENLESGASLRVLEGQSLRLLCVAHSNPPAQLSWARLGRTVSPSQPSDPGVLELPQIQTEQEGEFTCRAQNPLGSQNNSLSLFVVSPPQLLGPSCSQEDEGLRCSCSSRARPAPSLRWRLGERLLEGELSNASFEVASSSAGPWANSSLSLREGLSSGLRLSCEALNGHGAQSGSVLLLPDEKGLASGAFASGISLGIGVTTLLFLCFIFILVRTLRKKWTQAKVPAPAPAPAPGEAPRSRFSRRSTILDYINVIPKAGPLKQKAKPSSPSQPPPADGHSLEARKNQKELHPVSHNCPGPKSSLQASEAENNQEELHYAVLNFPGLRPWETQRPEGTHPEYAEIQFH
ncbi:sialic acid-binding Ig-like lectin 10 isoform X3 [Bos indicus x Bos taurus]|uniref:Sialic acid binding Ig like lectin 10 n=1 Tax=Bos taurus TaxID=9913 RepID=A0A3Q1NGX7_BOVIN|nr:sialic acid-binding Ig-like lectin 10 isoform X1 [Bos taurus]XP_010813586.1 sialic acid-binding Ig-like lectin 10 isoform X1 [Bos taurus]XP_010813587.1 sialic acid-binding Ig-like lectin 10 isoform X1 [Bos taurus]XP_027370769.1 sialic acid-binding Ig-like lectin 10 isoform X3 [Bos indicus x Bos taurus]XP_027370771.1 sialic acid-binding Ig-like lectin 10 isoform X3 [Bos indicus x Bos taurus]